MSTRTHKKFCKIFFCAPHAYSGAGVARGENRKSGPEVLHEGCRQAYTLIGNTYPKGSEHFLQDFSIQTLDP